MLSRSIFITIILSLVISNSLGQQSSNGINTSSSALGNNGGLIGTLRNTTGTLLQRLEGPRDRVVSFIKPVVKSDLSRNITHAISSIWSRVQATNISLIQHPLVKTSIVSPINSTLERLKQITAKENEQDGSNFEIVNLDNPENAQLYSTNSETSNIESPKMYTMNAESSNPILVELTVENEKAKKRNARFLDNYTYVSPDNVQNLFNNVRRNGMRQCLALALCESNCRPHLYSSSSYDRFRNLVSRVESFNSDHEDHAYYLDARRNGNSNSHDCMWCHRQYSCPHSRDYLVDQFSRSENFY